MAFVTCVQHKKSQEAQDEQIESLKDAALSAEDALLDKTSGEGSGKITAEKIKEAIAGDVEVAVEPNSGITGNGTKDDPLALNLGDGLKIGQDGKLNLADNVSSNIGKGLAGSGLTFNATTNKLDVNTVRLVDASGTVHLANVIVA